MDTYGTLLQRDIFGNVVNDGARHVIAGPWLGRALAGETKVNAVDHDSNGFPSALADGDDKEVDLEGYDDEDGIVFIQEFVPGQNVSVDVTMDRDDFDGRAWMSVDPSSTLSNDAFLVRAARYGEDYNGAEVTFSQVDGLPNDETGTIGIADNMDGKEYVTAFGTGSAKATVGTIDPEGPNNAFVIRAIATGSAYNGLTVRFEHSPSATASATWDGASTLVVTFDPGVTPISDLKTLVNNAASPLEFVVLDDMNALPVVAYDVDTTPYSLEVQYNVGTTTAQIIDAINATGAFVAEVNPDGDPDNDGSADISYTSLDGFSDALADGQWPGVLNAWIDFDGDGVFEDEYSSTGTIDPAGNDNAFQIVATIPGQVLNRVEVEFVTDAGQADTVVVTYGDKLLTISLQAGATIPVQDILDAVNAASDIPFQAGAVGAATGDIDPADLDGVSFLTDGAYERIFTNAALYDIDDQVNTLTFEVPSLASLTETYARFRVTSDGLDANGDLIGPDGLALSGEVEDYRLEIQPVDYGDAPDTYPTQLLKDSEGNIVVDGARHVIAGPTLGVLVDHDLEGQPSLDALGDDYDNDGSAELSATDVQLGAGHYATFAGTIGVIDPAGINNAFEIYHSGGLDGVQVNFELSAPGVLPTATWDGGANKLTIRFDDGVTTVAELIAAVNAATSPMVAQLADDPTNDDEDGVFADADGTVDFSSVLMIPGETAEFYVTVGGTGIDASSPVYLNAWIDFDADGLWQADEQIFGGAAQAIISVTATPMLFSFEVPADAAPGTTYARFRISSQEDLSYEGLAPDGEVEDYMAFIQAVDYGDASPAAGYATLPADNGARHMIAVAGPWASAPGPWIGSTEPDHDMPLAPTPDDDNTDVDDEDNADIVFYNAAGENIENLVLPGLVPGEWASVDVTLGGVNPLLYAWIDFNGDGDFDDSGTETLNDAGDLVEDWNEHLTYSDLMITTSGNVATIQFYVPSTVDPNTVYARFRVVDADAGWTPSPEGMALSSEGLPITGEVEDYAIAILPVDHGDMDQDSTEWANLGARHVIAGPYLGATAPDWEHDGQRTADATGDDTTGVDDEDGLSITDWWGAETTSLIQGEVTTFTITINVPDVTAAMDEALLYAWIDFTGDGDFIDSGSETQGATTYAWNEYLLQGVSFDEGAHSYSFEVYVPRMADGSTYIDTDTINLRFRVVNASDGWSPAIDTTAYSGEVEDYMLTLVDVDYGDMDPGPTAWEDDGARHVIGGPYLGTAPDSDNDGVPSAGADSDDLTNLADEDGVVINWNDSLIDSVLADNQLIPGESTTLEVTIGGVAGEEGYLYAWIDVERDGDWTGSGTEGSLAWNEVLADGLLVTAGATETLDLFVPRYDELGNAIEAGSVYARFRIISKAEYDALSADPLWTGMSLDGLAYTGEVEDYVFDLVAVDYGDADTDSTLWEDDGARHVTSNGPWMTTSPTGAAADGEADGQPNADATGDDLTNNDEEGVVLFDVLGNPTTELIPGEWATIQVTLDPNSPEDGYLYAWIDFNGDGHWGDSGTDIDTDNASQAWNEQIAGGVQLSLTDLDGDGAVDNVATISFFVPHTGITPGSINARFRLISATEQAGISTLPIDGIAYSGEVEDHQYLIVEVDYGDAPDNGDPLAVPNFPTLRISDGARHVSQYGPFMSTTGTATDWEDDGQIDFFQRAVGDDENGSADEDGVVLRDWKGDVTTYLVPGEWTTVEVTLDASSAENGRVYGWIDFNADGAWNDSGVDTDTGNAALAWSEQIADGSVSIAPGETVTLSFFVPHTNINPGTVNARFRLIGESEYQIRTAMGSEWALSYSGMAYSGEVEDYQYEILAMDYGDAPDDGDGDPTTNPDGSFPTLRVSDGARHVQDPNYGTWIWWTPDHDDDGQPNADATGDDDDGDTAGTTDEGSIVVDAWNGFTNYDLFPRRMEHRRVLGERPLSGDGTPVRVDRLQRRRRLGRFRNRQRHRHCRPALERDDRRRLAYEQPGG